MTTAERIEALEKLGRYLDAIDVDQSETLVSNVRNENPWFTPGSIDLAFSGLRNYLNKEKLRQWLSAYDISAVKDKQVAVVMAGNIPLAGFHDMLCVLASGNRLQAKLSSKDSVLPTFVIEKLIEIEPRMRDKISIVAQLKDFDAVIATGSDNSARYFEYYFGKYPHIIRKNRTSCAVISGAEDREQLRLLGRDVFSYFGLGCRNVSKIFVPHNFDVLNLLSAWDVYVDIIHHHKYHNNYDYQKAILLINKIPFYDSGFVILQESEKIVSPISVVYLGRYSNETELDNLIRSEQSKIQCIVGENYVPFGQAQSPELWDYADHVDTMNFLLQL